MSPAATPSQPLIPEKYVDAPSQRFYYLSLGLLCQVNIIFRKIGVSDAVPPSGNKTR